MVIKAGWKSWRGKEIMKLINNGSRNAVEETCEIVLEAGKQEVPLDEGTLMRSGIVKMAPGNKPEGVISFGGGPGTGHPVVPYAVRHHEVEANFQHGRKKRYLADPLNCLGESTLKKALQQELRGRLK
jgi:hypothetical protein